MGLLSRVRGRLRRLRGKDDAPAAEQVLATRSAHERHASEIIEEELDANRVLLFLYGTPDRPEGDDAAQIVAALRGAGVQFAHFDCHTHEEVWQCLKDVAGTPAFPLLFVDRKPVGGLGEIRDALAAGRLTT